MLYRAVGSAAIAGLVERDIAVHAKLRHAAERCRWRHYFCVADRINFSHFTRRPGRGIRPD